VVTDLSVVGSYVSAAGGGTVTWTVTNLGSMDANGILLLGHLPATLNIQVVATTAAGFCSQTPAFANSTRLACGLNTLPAGQTWTVTVSGVLRGYSAKAAALVSFRGTDPVSANNYALVLMQNNTVNAGTGGGGSKVPIRTPPRALLVPRRAVGIAKRVPD
jgi:hypothetical protein